MSRFAWWVTSGAFALLGWFVGYFGREILTLNFKKELGLGDVLQFVTTIFIAVLLGTYLQQKYGNKRIEKDIIIDQIREAKSLAKDVRELFFKCFNERSVSKDGFKAINGSFRNLSRAILLIEKALEHCRNNLSNMEAVELKHE